MSDPDRQASVPRPFVDAGIPTSRVHVDLAALTHTGARPNNEDAFAVIRLGRFMEVVSSSLPESDLPRRVDDTSHLLIVADGLGGAEGGEVASRMALASMVEQVLRSPRWALKLDDPVSRENEIRELLLRTRAYLQSMHATIRERQAQDPRFGRMGTTITSAYSVGDDLFIMHVGDSRAYSLRNGRLFRITRDHTVAQEYAEMGRLDPSEVASHPLSHVLTNAVGAPVDTIEFDSHHRDIEDGDRLLLCSDGLTKVATEDEIAAVMAAHPTSEAACRALVELTLAHGAPDNVTVVVAGYRID